MDRRLEEKSELKLDPFTEYLDVYFRNVTTFKIE